MSRLKLPFLVLYCLLGSLTQPASAQTSDNVTLRGHLDLYPSTWYSQCWGYTSPGGVELAIIGQESGTMFVNVTNPANPVQVHYDAGDNTVWREMKTYDHYSYQVCDQCNDGLQIVDLANPLAPVELPPITTFFSSAHTIWIDQDTGLLFALGTNNVQGAQVFDLNVSKTNPPRIFSFNNFYIHDFYSKDGIGYAAAINNGYLATIDLTLLPASMPVLDTFVTDGAFTHNVWTTNDQQYALTTDEVSGGHITIVDVSNPANMFRVGSYTLARDPNSIVHNVHMKDDIAYIAWYKAGLEIVDFSVPTNPQTLGYYDTYPGSGTGFAGAWGTYPFAESGLTYISDINTGLYVVEFDPTFGTIDGTVTNANTGQPIAGALVEIPAADEQATTEADGGYRINLDPGSYDVEITVFGYEPQTLELNVTEGNVTDGDAALEPLFSGVLQGFVRNADAGGVGLPGAEVALLGTPLATTSGLGGAYSFPQVPQGAYSLRARLFGFGALTMPVGVIGGITNTRDLSLRSSPIVVTMEANPNWTVGAAGDAASSGIWTRVEPLGTYSDGTPIQPETDHTVAPGTLCYVTGNGTDPSNIGEQDVDNGRTTLLTTNYNLTTVSDPSVRFHRWYVNDGNGSVDDVFRVDVSSNGGTSWVNLETLGQTRRFWEMMDFHLSDYIVPTNQVRFRFVAQDIGNGSIVEAGIDDFEIYGVNTPTDAPVPAATDLARLLHAAPNPISVSTGGTLRFQLAKATQVSLEILDVQGRIVSKLVDGLQPAGQHSIQWSGEDSEGRAVPGGIYFQRFRAGGVEQSEKLVVIR